MKVICDRGALVEALNLVSGVVPSRTPKPVLRCVKIEASEGRLTLAATDAEISILLGSARVEVEQPGTAVLPADKLQQIVRESIDPTLAIQTDSSGSDTTATIRAQDSKFTIFGHSAGDFPAVASFSGDADYEISAAELHKLVALTLFATARENSRYAINGVLIEREGKNLNVVATDGHRLALAKGSCTPHKDADKTNTAIVPSKALTLLLRLFDDAEQTVRVRVEESQILFSTDDATLVSHLVEGNFPPYKDVIPKDNDRKATIATDLLISGVRRAALLTNEESKGVRLAFDADGLTLTSRAPEMGEAEVKVALEDYAGEAVEIGFNPTYMLEALKVVSEAHVTLDMKATNKPGTLRAGPSFTYVVMPVNLQ